MPVQADTSAVSGRDPLREMLRACRSGFLTAVVFSFFVNLLVLVIPIYTFSLFDRVLGGGGNAFTLAILAGIAFGALLVQALIEIARTFLFVRISAWIDSHISEKVLAVSLRLASARGVPRNTELLNRMDSLRHFLAGHQIFLLMDLPWVPLFLAFLFFLNYWIGLIATAVAVTMLLLALANKWLTAPMNVRARAAVAESMRKTDITLRNADVIDAMGMGPQLSRRWSSDNDTALEQYNLYSRRAGIMGAVGRMMQLGSVIAIMTASAVLVLDPTSGLSQGAMMASVILVGRIMVPVQSMVVSWAATHTALEDYRTVSRALRQGAQFPEAAEEPFEPEPVDDAFEPTVAVNHLGFHPPTAAAPILHDVTFILKAGSSLGILGPTGSGKSSLARLLVGIDRPTSGTVQLGGRDLNDGRELHRWPSDMLGQHIGYLPQDVSLFSGTIRDNITRFADDWTRENVLDAARLASIDTMIKFMPNGYQTRVGPGGMLLSGGQVQRVAIARALYGPIRLVVLDEPNANLDVRGEQALIATILELKRRGVTVIVILHRENILRALDNLLVLADGRVQTAGSRDKVLARLRGRQAHVLRGGSPSDTARGETGLSQANA